MDTLIRSFRAANLPGHQLDEAQAGEAAGTGAASLTH
ncbi:hypothetical protein J2809_004088 [Arthrobacter pascens]|jgi:hypothetical protein|nr:hypothetical protein [Arthrobacter pascens]